MLSKWRPAAQHDRRHTGLLNVTRLRRIADRLSARILVHASEVGYKTQGDS